MRTARTADDASLLSWTDIASEFSDAILIGNGSSIAVSNSFNYSSLFEIACSDRVAHPLEPSDRELFESINETDFERVLGELARAATLAERERLDAIPLKARYARIRQALIEAIHAVHPRYDDLSDERFKAVQAALLHFTDVFCTNYDLLVYWAVTSTDRMDDFRDFFWNPGLAFELADTWTPNGKTRIYYLHGALHLFHLRDGRTVKATGGDDNPWSLYVPLLDLTFEYKDAEYPLFVSEGSSQQKMAAIGSNAYLSFAYQAWKAACWDWPKTLVVFGHSCGEQDEHLLRPLLNRIARAKDRGWDMPKIAVSIVARDTEHIRNRKNDFRERLHDEVIFFDAKTHPLGQAGTT